MSKRKDIMKVQVDVECFMAVQTRKMLEKDKIMKEEMNKEQLNQCILDLATRANELQETDISIVLFTLAGSLAVPDECVGKLADECLQMCVLNLQKMNSN